MIRYWQRRFREGIKTQNLKFDKEIAQIRKDLRNEVAKKFAGSLAIRMVDSGSCNACEAECNALSNPYYDLERLGIYFVASPRHADVLLVSGVVTFNMYHHLLDAYEQLPDPKWVVTLGGCAAGEIFAQGFAIKGPVHKILPVTHHIPGCPPSPEDIIAGLLTFIKKL
ncbi:NADH-quinone oxidoreductase subunit B family protein [Nitratiruptor sp. YY09-18]|uniref:NADH-quinone oxidoreductase subunit B family protein n=1 Tax=Nitratiruptor sp. YY09-18 TaxID=2724901 RepID=UPI001914F536|nr:hydrogenase [Nitratiruptor sp. YY09-18]BCD67284.1 formate hydrogenlyase subunit 7 [Nitratiruptor sp. YY09-18]